CADPVPRGRRASLKRPVARQASAPCPIGDTGGNGEVALRSGGGLRWTMSKTRMETFSDGVIAILITIMVLELHIPHGTTLASLRPLAPTFSSYALSFVFLG